VGEDDYEITARRGGALPPQTTPPAAAPAVPPAEAEPAAGPSAAGDGEPVPAEPAVAGRDNGVRFGVRFRRGSRGGLRTAEYPLVGVVQIDEPAQAAAAASLGVAAETVAAEEPGAKPARSRRAPRKKTGTTRAKAEKPAKADAAPSPPEEAPAATGPAKRPRSRTRKKAE
jgi:hypothetical protein